MWLALAMTQWRVGRLESSVLSEALAAIDEEPGHVAVACCNWWGKTVDGWIWAPGASYVTVRGVYRDVWGRSGYAIPQGVWTT
jgi:hypothetical protein